MTQRQPRKLDAGYLEFLRGRFCLTCGRPPRSDPAHIRASSAAIEEQWGKRYVGGHEKPDDRWALPLCRSCHVEQHMSGNEIAWWARKGRCPFTEAARLYEEYGGDGGKPKKKRTTIKPRLPKEQRAKIRSRGFPKVKRAFR